MAPRFGSRHAAAQRSGTQSVEGSGRSVGPERVYYDESSAVVAQILRRFASRNLRIVAPTLRVVGQATDELSADVAQRLRRFGSKKLVEDYTRPHV